MRPLSAGAKGANRVARATGIDRALDQAAEEAILRVLRSPALLRALTRAAESDDLSEEWDAEEVARLVKVVLQSEIADQVWAEVLESEQTQALVERIAGAPEIRAAIASQGAGLITDIGVRLTVLTERLDDALERIVRRRDPDSETNQAGLATRLVAAAVDLGLLFGAYLVLSSVLAGLTVAIFGHHLSLIVELVLIACALAIGGAFFETFWALAGQTPGMRFLSIRLIHKGSPDITAGVAIRRTLALLLVLLPAGLGYFAILRDPRRRGWHDRMVSTEVIYDARARARARARAPGAQETRVPGARDPRVPGSRDSAGEGSR